MKLKVSPFAPAVFPVLPPVAGMRAKAGSRGFYASRGLQRDDVFLAVFDDGTSAAGVFTTSHTASADVLWCRETLASSGGIGRALVVNSGNSNAFTGPKGKEKNDATLAAIMAALGVEKSHCYLAATGVIGEPLADPNFVGSIVPELADGLTAPNFESLARAFMTTDTYPKGAGATCAIGDVTVNLAGIAKGSGMIEPNMATMLAYVFTDASIAPDVLQTLLVEATDTSFNAITVDSDTSTSDTLMVFATGATGAPLIDDAVDPRLVGFKTALGQVCLDLAQQIVRDGEGASKFVTINVKGAETPESAKTIAFSVANSPLVKTALAAGDANWGRIVMAVGKCREPIDQNALAIWFGDLLVAEGGARADGYSEARAGEICAASDIEITVDVGVGTSEARVYTCDLTQGYVEINGAYRT